MTGARPTQTTCVTERRASTRAIDLTLCGSSCVDMTTIRASGGAAWTSTNPCAFKNSEGVIMIGTSATDVVSVGEQFQFPRPGNG